MKIRNVAGIIQQALFSALAIAGNTQPAPIAVTLNGDGSGSATGDMVTARYSDNDIEFIGCGIRVYDDGAGGSFQYGFCQASDSAENRAFCTTQRSDILEVMKATSDYSFITFSWDAAGECREEDVARPGEGVDRSGGPGQGGMRARGRASVREPQVAPEPHHRGARHRPGGGRPARIARSCRGDGAPAGSAGRRAACRARASHRARRAARRPAGRTR